MDLHKNSQNSQILKWLKRGRTLTPLQAFKMFGTLRLGGRILELRQRGYDISTKMVELGNKRVARYSLMK